MFVLMLLLTQASPEAQNRLDAGRVLDEAAQSGDLMIVETGGDEAGRSTAVLEVNVHGCFVTLKTEIEATSFTAKFVELGEGSLIEPIQKNEIRLRSGPEIAGELVLRSSRSIDGVLQALRDTQTTCAADAEIF